MLTKIGNLLGLQSTKQSQLNLGVIQSLAGEVFNTDNCTVIENSNGFTLRHPNGSQFCWSVKQVALPTTSGQRVIQSFNVPSPFTPANPVAKTFGVSIGHALPYSAYDYGFDGGASSPNVAFVSTIRGASEVARTATVTVQWAGTWS